VRVTSRNNQAQIDAYGRKLARNADIPGERIEPLSLKTAAAAKVKRKTSQAGDLGGTSASGFRTQNFGTSNKKPMPLIPHWSQCWLAP
jgi:hypothetical protein